MAFDYDVIIVGAGVAGALCAYKIAQHPGVRILLLDPGDNKTDDAQRKAYVKQFALAPNRRSSQISPFADLVRDRYAPNADGSDIGRYYMQSTIPNPEPGCVPAQYKVPYQRLVGGSTWSWRGNCPRYIPNDFKIKAKYGLDIDYDWPLTYDTLEPWYCDAEAELGIACNSQEWGNDAAWVKAGIGGTRSKDFPMPPVPLGVVDKLVKQAIGDMTIPIGGETRKVEVITTPQARVTLKEGYNGRPQCAGNSNCIPICPIGAKYDAGVHLRKAFDTKNADIRYHSVVTRLEVAESGNAHTVVFRDWSQDPGKEQRLTAKIVVLAANAIESAKIWLMSPLGNKSGQVGRNLMDHVQQEIVGLFPEPVYTFRGPQGLSGIEVFRDGEFRKDFAAFRMSVGNDGWGRFGLPEKVLEDTLFGRDADPTSTKIVRIGEDLRRTAANKITRMIRISYSTEQLPRAYNRVTLSDHKDALGVPRPQITYQLDQYTQKALQNAYTVARGILDGMRLGGKPVEAIQPQIAGPPAGFNTAAHAMGTLRLGTDDTKSVVNPFGLSHEHKNLYVVGSSVFVTAATANPTLTIAALALRTAEQIVTRL